MTVRYHPQLVSAAVRTGKLALFVILSAASAGLLAADRVVPDDYDTIQQAIDAADPDDTVLVKPGTYRENITLRSDIVLRGGETARTWLEGDGENPLIVADGVTNARISNFTFIDTAVGVRILGNADIIVAGNVFHSGKAGTAIAVMDSAAADISNNTFHDNGMAIDGANSAVSVRSNLFYENGTAITPADLTENIGYNGFLDNRENGSVGTNALLDKPLRFVNREKRDFHLRHYSEAIDKGDEGETDLIDGTRADMGAYGGPYADVIPLPVSGLHVESGSAGSVAIKWEASLSYLSAGYKLYYGNDESLQGTGAAEGDSPIDTGDVTRYSLSGLTAPAAAELVAPVIDNVSPSHQTLHLSWSSVKGATGYRVHYGIDSVSEHEVDTGSKTSYRLQPLQNGVVYRMAVSAYSQATYHFAVTVYDSTGNRHESQKSRVKASAGPVTVSPLSGEATAFPEAIEPYPNLPDEGCFVATAAYGYYSAPQVQLLRDFRDRYLLTHSPGRAFVSWYYEWGPVAARWLDRHVEFKPVVRVALFPALIVAGIMLDGRLFFLVMLGVILVTMSAFVFRNYPVPLRR